MADLTITVPGPKANKVYDAFNRAFGDPNVNPTTDQKIAFVKGKLVDHIIGIVNADEKTTAAKTASDAVVLDTGVAS